MTFGVWGTSDLERLAVTVEKADPTRVIAYLRTVGENAWVIETDPERQVYRSPAEAAQAAVNALSGS